MSLLYGFAALLAIWFVAKMFAGSNPALLAAYMKKGAGAAAMALAAFLMLRGRIDMAMLVGGFGAWLLGWAYSHPLAEWTRNWKVSSGKTSKVSSSMIEMELNHDSGDMRGRVLTGDFAGRELDTLSPDNLKQLIETLRTSDAEGLKLLDAYLDRRFAGGGEHAQADADTGSRRPREGGAMSQKEAYDILGLQPGAEPEAIRQAHRALIKRLHPDTGGSSALAAKVNEAKDILLKGHG